MPEWLVIARREFSVRVRTKWFIIVTLLGPVGMVALVLVPAYLSAKAGERDTTIQLIDRTADDLGAPIAAGMQQIDDKLEIELIPDDTPEATLMQRLRDSAIDGYLVLPEDLLTGGEVQYRGANATNIGFVQGLQETVQHTVWLIRWEREGLTTLQYGQIHAPVPMDLEHTTGKSTGVSGKASFILGYAVMFILYMAILLYAVNVLRSVVEEKTSRVMEIMVSSVKPLPMMLGKILGVGSVGLLQLGLWIVMAVLIFQYRAGLLGLFGVEAGGGFTLPALGFDAVFVVLAYFFAGYFFYATLYAGIGAMVNSEQEAQQVQTPVIVLLIIPVACVQLIANDPRGDMAQVFTMVPFSSPILMPMRYLLGGASWLEVGVSLGILLVTLAGASWLAARVYRVGILMYGKRPSLGEVVRWIRHE